MSRTVPRLAVFAILFGLAVPAWAERAFSDFSGLQGLQRITLTSDEGNRLDLIRYAGSARRPAIVVIPGSLCAPAFAALDSAPGEAFATVPLLSKTQRELLGAHIVYLDRRNIVSLETMSSAPEFSIEQIFKLSPCTDQNGAVTLEQRVSDSLTQIKWLRQQDWVTSVHLVGVSEGADVAAGVAAADESVVDTLMLVGGAGPSQFADFAAFARDKGDLHGLSAVFADLDQFLASNPPESYKGYDSKRWQSFAINNSALDLLLRSDIPVFIVHGDKDESVPVSSADLAAIELMRKQPNRAIFYWSVIGGGHMLETEEGGRMNEAITQYLSWATSIPKGRVFKTK